MTGGSLNSWPSKIFCSEIRTNHTHLELHLNAIAVQKKILRSEMENENEGKDILF